MAAIDYSLRRRVANLEADIGQSPNGTPSSAVLSTQTTSTQTIQSNLTLASQKKLNLSVSDGGSGSITRLIELHATNIVDRPWIGWFDQNGRLVGATGFHDTLTAAEGGAQIRQFEVKTLADPNGPNPTEQRTRLAIQYDVQRGVWGVNFIDSFEINQGENPIATTPGAVTPFGLRLRTAPQDTAAAGSSNFVAAQFTAQVDASDNALAFLDVNVPYKSGGTLFAGNKTATLNIFRNTNTSSASSPQLAVKKGDGSNTNAMVFIAPSGTLTITGPIGVNGAAASKPTVTGAKGSNAALASLMTALSSIGLVTDSTTA